LWKYQSLCVCGVNTVRIYQCGEFQSGVYAVAYKLALLKEWVIT